MAITAAAGGIGLEIARGFARQGDRVYVCDLDPAAVDAAAAEGLAATQIDVADGPALDRWLDSVLTNGGLDVLVNNAGIAGPAAPVEQIDPTEWDRCLAVNLTSHFRACARAIPAMKAAGTGSIVNVSSTSGLYGVGLRSPYVAAKWALVGLTKSLAIELGPHNVRVNAVCPGSVAGERISAVIAREASARGVTHDVVEREFLGGQSIARFVQPREVADLCLFLASDAARMITGQAIAVDGHTEAFHIG